MNKTIKYNYGWKALSNGCTYHNEMEFRYHLPTPGQQWGAWTEAPNQPVNPDGQWCGAGGLHLHKSPSFAYAPPHARLYLARYLIADILGENTDKIRVRKCQLLHIPLLKWLNLVRKNKHHNLYGANLRRADLYEADLRKADLRNADLRGANLYEADLRGAVLPNSSMWAPNIDMTTFKNPREANEHE